MYNNFPVTADGKTGISGALWQAINQIGNAKDFGVFLVPEGKK